MTLTLVDVQTELITQIKSSANIISLLSDSKEVREINWVGAKFSYPNIRVRTETFKRHTPDCDIFDVTAVVLVFGDDASSLKVDTIASTIFNFFDRKQLNGAVLHSVTRIQANQLGAEWVEGNGVWRSAVELQFQAK